MDCETECKVIGRATTFLFLAFTCFAGCETKETVQCRIAVAGSALKATENSLSEFRALGKAEQQTISVVGGPSNGLAQLIQSGAKTDIFISANPQWTEAISGKCQTVSSFVGNQLVLASHVQSTDKLETLNDLARTSATRIAIATDSVPVGEYARETLEKLSQSNQEWLKPKLVFGKDSSALVAWLENREVDFAFVYSSDIERSSVLKASFTIDSTMHRPIEYSIARLKSSDSVNDEFKDKVFHWLRSEQSLKIFSDAGFSLPAHHPVGSSTID